MTAESPATCDSLYRIEVIRTFKGAFTVLEQNVRPFLESRVIAGREVSARVDLFLSLRRLTWAESDLNLY